MPWPLYLATTPNKPCELRGSRQRNGVGGLSGWWESGRPKGSQMRERGGSAMLQQALP
jgi:hypothetical protein